MRNGRLFIAKEQYDGRSEVDRGIEADRGVETDRGSRRDINGACLAGQKRT